MWTNPQFSAVLFTQQILTEAVVWRCSVKNVVLNNFAKLTGKHLCQSLLFNKVAGLCNVIKKNTLAEVFSCGFCEIFKNTFFYITPMVAASLIGKLHFLYSASSKYIISTWEPLFSRLNIQMGKSTCIPDGPFYGGKGKYSLILSCYVIRRSVIFQS